MITSIVTRSPAETSALAESLATTLCPPATLALYGQLGAGKTCFVKGLARGLGSEDLVNSPTFTLVHQYQGSRCRIRHFDLYRIRDAAELEDLEVLETPPDTVTVIEWPEIMEAHLDPDAIRVRLEADPGEPDARKITLEWSPKAGASLP